jgi:hypothetical protein
LASIGQAYSKVREKVAAKAAKILPDTCHLIVGEDDYWDVPCKLAGGSSNLDNAPYRIRFAWGSPAVVGATVLIDEVSGRQQLTLQLIGPIDSSTGIWQEWQATAGPGSGRVDVGL